MVFDPASLSLDGWWRADYGGSPWAAVASAGGSGSNGNLTQSFTPPSTGATANGKVSANFDGTNDKLDNANGTGTFVGNAAWSCSGVVAADTVAAHNTGAAYLDEAIVTEDVNGFFYVNFTSSGIVAGHLTTGIVFAEIVKACPADGAPHTFHAWYDGTSLHLTVDGSSATPVTAANALGPAGNLKVGSNYDGSTFFDGRIWDLILATTDLGGTARTNIESYFQARYFTDPGLISAATTSATFSQTGSVQGSATAVGTSALTFTQAGSVKGSVTCGGTTATTFTPAGTLGGSISCVGTSTLVFAASLLGDLGATHGSTTLTFAASATGAILTRYYPIFLRSTVQAKLTLASTVSSKTRLRSTVTGKTRP